MIAADALQVLKCWLFISQTIKYKHLTYKVDCVDIDSIDYHSSLANSYINIIDSGCTLDGEETCQINDYVELIKTCSKAYQTYEATPCIDLSEHLCNITTTTIDIGQPVVCTTGFTLTQL